MSTQWPLVKAQLLAVLPTLPGWPTVTVFNGAPTRATLPTDFATVGYVANDIGGTYTKTQDPSGYMWQEAGTVRTQIACNGGNVDITDPQLRVFALADAFETWVRADRRLGGVLSPNGTTDIGTEIATVQGDAGAAIALVVNLTYFTVT